MVSIAEGRAEIFTLAPDNTIVYNSFPHGSEEDSAELSGWKILGGNFVSAVSAVVRDGRDNIELYGMSPDGALWDKVGKSTPLPVNRNSQ